MNRIQFFPSEKLDKSITSKAKNLGMSKGDVAKFILENIDFELFFQERNVKPKNIDIMVEEIYKDIMIYARNNKDTEFVLNDINSFRATPINVRASLGKKIYKKIISDNSGFVFPVSYVDENGVKKYKKRQRAMLYKYQKKEERK